MAVSGSMMNPSIADGPTLVTPIQSTQVAASVSPITTKVEARTSATASSLQKNKKPINNPNAGVEAAVREYFADIPLMIEISRCESKFRQFDAYGNVLQGVQVSEDTGAFQVNKTYHLKRSVQLGYNIDTLAGNMAYSRLLYSDQGYWPWASSYPCWGKSPLAANFKARYEARQVAKAEKAALAANMPVPATTAGAAAANGADTSVVINPVVNPAAIMSSASVSTTIDTSIPVLADNAKTAN